MKNNSYVIDCDKVSINLTINEMKLFKISTVILLVSFSFLNLTKGQIPSRESYYYYHDSATTYLWQRDSIVCHSGYYFSYKNVIIRLPEYYYDDRRHIIVQSNPGDTIDMYDGKPVLITDSIKQPYEIVNIRKNPLRNCPQWQKKGLGSNFIMIDVVDTLHTSRFTILSFKDRRNKSTTTEKIKIGNTYDMILYDVSYPPRVMVMQFSPWEWADAPSLNLSFNRQCCKVFPLMISPNIDGLYYVP